MKTLGEILTSARHNKNLTLKQVSSATKIESRHLRALEEDDYASLPHPAFTKGFIRKYAAVLDKPPEELVAVYRRDYHLPTTPAHPTPPTNTPSHPSHLFLFNKSTTPLFLIGLIAFLGYLTFQYRALLIPPPLEIFQPQDSSVVTSPVTIEGKTSSDSLITLDPGITLKPDSSGSFITQINLSPGAHQIKITASNRFSQTAVKTLSLTIVSQ